MGLNVSFWNNKKVFLTGNTGFKGSWITELLINLGAKVYGFSLQENTEPCLYEILDLNSEIKQTFSDIRDYNALDSSMNKFKPDILIHMAAQPLVRPSYHDPRYTYETNVMGTVNVLEVAKNINSIKSILVVTSDKCYKNLEVEYSYKETDFLGGHDPYSNSKACSDLIATSYYQSFFSIKEVGLGIARAGNVIGGGDWSKNRIIPDLVRAYSKNKPLIIRYPNAMRPWQYVLDPIYGYLLLVEKIWEDQASFSGPWNFGPATDKNKSVEYVCNRITKLWGKNSNWISEESKDQMHEATLLMLDSEKAKKNILWKPKFDINRAIDQTIKWYLAYYDGQDMKNITKMEIDNYLGNHDE